MIATKIDDLFPDANDLHGNKPWILESEYETKANSLLICRTTNLEFQFVVVGGAGPSMTGRPERGARDAVAFPTAKTRGCRWARR